MSFRDQRVGQFRLEPRKADLQPCLQQIGAVCHAKIDFGIDCSIRRK